MEMPSPTQDMKDPISVEKEAGTTDQPIPPGMRLDSKELYREDKGDTWGVWIPDDIDMDPEDNKEAKKYALVVRREKRVGQKSSLVLHSVTVQSPLIRKFLGAVFEGYKGMTTKLKDLTFNAPFHEFFYCWERFQQQIREETDELASEHIKLLQGVISGEIQPHIEKRQELLDNGLVTFEYLWALFEPDTLIYKQSDGHDRLYELVGSSYRKPEDRQFFNLTCRYIDCDGIAFGYMATSLRIMDFDGIRLISELSILPIHLHSQIGVSLERLFERGKSFVELNGFHYKSYSGLCTVQEGYPGNSTRQSVGRSILHER